MERSAEKCWFGIEVGVACPLTKRRSLVFFDNLWDLIMTYSNRFVITYKTFWSNGGLLGVCGVSENIW